MRRVFCESSGALVPKDKAVKRFIVRNIVESAAIRDLQEACVYEAYQLPKLYRKVRSATRLLTTPRFVPLRCRGAARGLASKPQLQAGCTTGREERGCAAGPAAERRPMAATRRGSFTHRGTAGKCGAGCSRAGNAAIRECSHDSSRVTTLRGQCVGHLP